MSHHLNIILALNRRKIHLEIFPFLIICPVAAKVKHNKVNFIIAGEIQEMVNYVVLNSAIFFHELLSPFNFDDILAFQGSYFFSF
jgi:hypothetical protein